MAKAEFGTAKYLSNQMKARGLQKLKFYCQVCQKQCRDENGFRSHIRSPSHMKHISHVSDSDIQKYTKQFEDDFLRLLRLTHGEKEIGVNKFYNEFIQDRHHIHMNATHFTSLTKFIQHLSKEGKIRVIGLESGLDDDIDPGHLLISYIDKSHKNIVRKAKLEDFSRNQESEQETKAKLLQRQIENFKKHEPEETNGEAVKVEESNISLEDGIHIQLKGKMGKRDGAKKSKKKNRSKVTKNVFK